MDIVVDIAAQPTSSAGDHDYSAMPTTTEEKLHHAQMYIADCETKIAELQAEMFSLKRFSSDPKLIKFYTGFPSYETLINFYRCLTPHIQTMTTWTQMQRAGSSGLAAAVQVLLVILVTSSAASCNR